MPTVQKVNFTFSTYMCRVQSKNMLHLIDTFLYILNTANASRFLIPNFHIPWSHLPHKQ